MRRSQLPQLERQLVEIARRQAAATAAATAEPDAPCAPRRRGHRRALAFALVTLALALLSAVALAATGVLSIGVPFRDSGPSTPRPTPRRGIGVTEPAGTRLLPLRIPDPVGGPAWGMRIVHTSRSVGCVQLGRVVDGRLGVLGQDGVEHDDGRFHPFPDRVLEADDCAPLDARGHLYRGPTMLDTDASGPTAEKPCLQHRCPAADARALVYAVLGPLGRSVTYELDGRDHTIPAHGPDGVVLAVLPGAPFEGWNHPGRLVRWTFRDGTVCHALCRPPGFVARPASHLRPADVRTALHVTQRFTRDPDGYPETLVEATFRTRVAITSAASAYVLDLKLNGPSCAETEDGSQTRADYRRGQLVHMRATITAGCPGTIDGRLALHVSSPSHPAMGDIFDVAPFEGGGVLVGRFSAPQHAWPKRLLRRRP